MKTYVLLVLIITAIGFGFADSADLPGTVNAGVAGSRSFGISATELATLQSLVTIIGGCIAAGAAIIVTFKALAEWRRAIEQRKEELTLRQREFRHKQATFARDLVKEVFADKKSRAALTLLDWLRADYEDDDGEKHEIRREEVQNAMRTSQLKFTDKEKFIRTRFEALYDYLEQIENLIELAVITFDDIETTFRYYMVRALRPEIRHLDFLNYYDYPKAKTFLGTFHERAKVVDSLPGYTSGIAGCRHNLSVCVKRSNRPSCQPTWND